MSTFDLRTDMHHDDSDANKKRVVFMGSGSFALPTLENLIAQDTACNVVAVYTKSEVRNKQLHNVSETSINIIKEVALLHGVLLLQPQTFNTEVIKSLADLKPDLIIVASYGKILPQTVLDIPTHGAINIHASLLPKLRGASPIQNALIDGLSTTGITIMKMDAGLDTGDIISQAKTPITPHMQLPDLERALATQGMTSLFEILPQWCAGEIETHAQNNDDATICQLIERNDGHIVWLKETTHIYNLYRALTLWPGVFSFWKKPPAETIRIKLTKIHPYDGSLDLSAYVPGEVFLDEKTLYIRTFDSAIIIETLQQANRNEMSAKDFLNGNQDFVGTILV